MAVLLESDTAGLVDYAVKEQRFIFYYQPYFSAKSLTPIGVEMLARIVAKDNSIVMPSMFIDYLEKSDYLPYFEKTLLQTAAEKAKMWAGINITFNISAKSIQNPQFIEHIKEICRQGNGYESYTIELVERTICKNISCVSNIMSEVKTRACQYTSNLNFAIDDFGIEYSSLSYICRLPIDVIKIDMSFVHNIEKPKTASVVKTIIALAKELNMKTLAEGIETKEQCLKMKEIGCDYLQGFYLSKPLPEEQIQSIVKIKNKIGKHT